MAKEYWTKSMLEAFEYAFSMRQQGYTSKEAVELYRLSGGRIATSDFNAIWRVSGEILRKSLTSGEYAITPYVPASQYTDVGFDYREEYVHVVEAIGYRSDTGKNVRRYITVESDRRLSLREIEDESMNILHRVNYEQLFIPVGISRVFFLHRSR